MHIFASDIKTTVDKITFCNKEEAIARMNRWAGEGTPFFFMISYYGNQCVVEKPEDVCADELLYQFPAATNVRIGDDGEQWHTPSHPLLKGTHRQFLIDNGMMVEREIKTDELSRYTKIRLFNAMIHFGEIEFSTDRLFISNPLL